MAQTRRPGNIVPHGTIGSSSGAPATFLITYPDHPYCPSTKDELLRGVWGFRASGATRTPDSHACRLRQKLGEAGDRFVVNVWSVGYRLVSGAVPEHAVSAA